LKATAAQALDTQNYVNAVLGPSENTEPERPITEPADEATSVPVPAETLGEQ